MTDEQQLDAERAAIRDHFQAILARAAAITPDQWAAERGAEHRVVREHAAALRRSAA